MIAVRVVDEVRVGVGGSAHGRGMRSGCWLGRLLLWLWLIILNGVLWLIGGLLWLIGGLLWLIGGLLWLIGGLLWLVGGLLWLVGGLLLLIRGLLLLLVRGLLISRLLIRLLVAWRGLLIRSRCSSLLLTRCYKFESSYGKFDKTGLPIW